MKHFVVGLLLLAGCIQSPYCPRSETALRISEIHPDSIDAWFTGVALDSLPYALGAPWRYAAFRAKFADGTSLAFLPLDEDDEHRYLVRMSKNGQDGPILAIGFMEPTWFSPERADTLATYEGWVFLYDMAEGLRRISVLFEGRTVLDRSTDFPVKAKPPDVLSDSDCFSCLVQEMLIQPDIPSRIHMHPDDEALCTRLAQYVRSFFRCSSTSPALP